MQYEKYHQLKRHIAVDCVIFGYEQEQLKLLVFKRAIEPAKGKWSLIGGWVKEEESVEDAARRVLVNLTGLQDVFMEQVQTFSKPNRDPGGNVVTVSFYALVKVEKYSNQLIHEFGAEWINMSELPSLIFDHDEMVARALEKLRLKSRYDLIGRQLLPEKFTITSLRKLYNEIFQKQFDPGNFRKKVLSLKVLERLEEKDMSESRKGAFYYKFNDIEEEGFNDPIFKQSF